MSDVPAWAQEALRGSWVVVATADTEGLPPMFWCLSWAKGRPCPAAARYAAAIAHFRLSAAQQPPNVLAGGFIEMFDTDGGPIVVGLLPRYGSLFGARPEDIGARMH